MIGWPGDAQVSQILPRPVIPPGERGIEHSPADGGVGGFSLWSSSGETKAGPGETLSSKPESQVSLALKQGRAHGILVTSPEEGTRGNISPPKLSILGLRDETLPRIHVCLTSPLP